MEKKYLDLTGLQDVASHVNTRLKTVTTMPLSADNGAVRLYVGNTTNTYIQGHIYQYDLANTEWKDITATSPSTSAYHAAGTKTVAELTSSLLVAANEGNVYNITDSGVTTADFIEGAGKPIRVGDNVGICEPTSGTYKFDLLSGFIAIDSVPTDGSTNPVESNGVYNALEGKVNKSTYGGVIGSDGNVLNLNENIGIFNSLETGLNLYTKTTNNATKYGVSTIPTSSAVDGEFSNIIVNEFNAITSFAVGDYTKHEGKLYKCTTAHSSGAWNADHFSEVKLIDEVKNKEINIKANTELIKDTVGWTNKNELEIYSPSNQTHGVTATITNDRRVSLTGTADTAHVLSIGDFDCKANVKYILSGCPSGGGTESSNYWLDAYIVATSTIVNKDTGNGCELLFNADTTVRIRIRIPNGLNTAGMVFSPMIRKAEILDSTFEPYRGTTAFPRDEQRVLSAKNLCPKANFIITNGITFTVDNDGVVTANGTSSSSDAICKIPIPSNLEGNFYFSGCPSGGGSNLYDVYMYDVTTSARPTKWDGVTTSGTDTGNKSE